MTAQTAATTHASERRGPARLSVLEAAAWRAALAMASRIRIGYLTVVEPDGRRHAYGDESSALKAEIRVHDRAAARRITLHGDTREAMDLGGGPWHALTQLPRTLLHRSRRNSVSGSRKNIAAHYDLGNDFYRLFLDETMTYSSAVFESPDQSLADAQRNKYRRMAEGAGLRPGMHVLEIGSGWGGFAIYAASELGCRVTSVTISKAQRDLAVERVKAAGLQDLVDIQLRDYRDIEGTYDAIVSIEMLEAVGAEYYEAFFAACDRALKPGGRVSLQTIAFPDVAYERQRRGANWIQLYIFPGGLLPSLAVIERSLHRTRLLVSGVTDIAPSYVRTLQEWRSRFMANLDSVRAQGFDERFIRMWEYYLAISEIGFDTGLTQDFQLVLEKKRGLEV